MKKWRKILGISLICLVLIGFGALVVVSRREAHTLVCNPTQERNPIDESPADYGMDFETLTLTTEDGCKLAAWYVPSKNGAALIAQHGYKGGSENDAQRSRHVVTARVWRDHG